MFLQHKVFTNCFAISADCLGSVPVIDFGACLTALMFHFHQFMILLCAQKRNKSKSKIQNYINI